MRARSRSLIYILLREKANLTEVVADLGAIGKVTPLSEIQRDQQAGLVKAAVHDARPCGFSSVTRAQVATDAAHRASKEQQFTSVSACASQVCTTVGRLVDMYGQGVGFVVENVFS